MKDRIAYALRRASHPMFILGATLTGVGVAFNTSYGISLGGDDPLRTAGMALVFFGAIIAKDTLLGTLVAMFKSGRYGVALLCAIGFLFGAATSLIAALGSASEGRDAKADPRQALIDAHAAATKTVNDADARLKEIGRVANVGTAEAEIARQLGNVDRGIAKRTNGCTVLAHDGLGPKQIAANRVACQPVQDAIAALASAKEAEKLRARRDAAQDVIAKGKPKHADAGVGTVAALWGRVSGGSSEVMIATVFALVVGLFVEVGAPIAWAIWQLSGPTFSADRDLEAFRATISERLPDRDGPTVAAFLAAKRLPETPPENDPPKPRKRAPAPTFSGNVIPIGKHPVLEAIEKSGGSISSNRALAKLMGVSDGEATKRRAEIEDMLTVEKIGKECRIAIKTA